MADPSKTELPTHEEVWKDIKGYEGMYQISNFGNVKSLERMVQNGKRMYRRKERLLALSTKWNRRKEVSLSLDKVKSYFLVHRLVAFAFLGDPPPRYEVNHKDGNPQNNVVDNLEWVSRSYNNHHSWEIGLKNQDGSKNPSAKLTDSDVLGIRELLKTGNHSNAAIARMYSVSTSNICQIKLGKTWSHI